MVAGTLYFLLFVGCFVAVLVTLGLASFLYVIGKRREAREAAARAARREARAQKSDAPAVLSDDRGSDESDRGGTP